jgi:hypothetical protein
MAGTRFLRSDLVIRIRRTQTDDDTLIEIDGEHPTRQVVSGAILAGVTAQISASDLALALWNNPQIQDELGRWQQTRTAGFWGTQQIVERLCLRIDDDRLIAFPLEQSLHHVLTNIGTAKKPHLPIPRLTAVPARVAQVPLSLPLRLLQLDSRGDFDLPAAIRAVFGTHTSGRGSASIMQVKADHARRFAGWALPSRWRTVDVLHLDQIALSPDDQLLATSMPDRPGTLGWLARCVDLWRTRLVVIRGAGSPGIAELRRLAHRLSAQGGPAVWLVDDGSPDQAQRLQLFYASLIHDAPIDVAVGMAAKGLPLEDTLVVGTGREELLRVSTPGDDLATLAVGLRDPDLGSSADAARRLWSAVAANRPNALEAAGTFAKAVRSLVGIAERLPDWHFDIHEGDGIVPLGREIGRLRQAIVTTRTPPAALRPTSDETGPRFANIGLWELDPGVGRTQEIPQPAARLRQGEPIVLGIQLGPRAGYAPVLDAIALIEEPFKWEKGQSGVWLSIGVTGLDFAVIDTAIQEVWLPRQGASDLVEFIVEPTRSGISQLRICVYYGADLLQSHRLAAIVHEPSTVDGGATSASLAAALGVATDRVGAAGWLARMEYAAAADLAAPPQQRDVALSVFANDIGGRRVFTVRGTEGYQVLLAGDTGDLGKGVRKQLDATSRDEFDLYAFRERDGTPLHSATPQRRDQALHDLAKVGWNLYSMIFSRADRASMAADLEGDRRIIHVAHLLLEDVIPWAAIYDRPYDSDRRRDAAGLPVVRTVCPAGLPDATGQFAVKTCGTHASCPLSPQGRATAAAAGQGISEDAIVCGRHFWGFCHIVELPPYQTDWEAGRATGTAGAFAAPPRRNVTSAGKPLSLVLGYNAALLTAQAHRGELEALLSKCKLTGIWDQENDRDALLAALGRGAADLVYLFCHARGGVADPKIDPPALELQDAVGGPPTLIRAQALADGLQLTHHPLVILNGCNTAMFSPDALSPFIRTLARDCEAAGALGTEIPVFELLAGEVARKFLTRFLDGESAGEALLSVRRDLLSRGNPMGLAYTLYSVAELKIVQ